MRKFFLFCSLLLIHFILWGQNIGIGTVNPQNKLHVAGGFRLDTLVNGMDSGLLRHNSNGVVYSLKFTDNINDVLRGDGSFGPDNSGWLLTGNAGINPAVNFIGTTGDQPLCFRVNNIHAGALDFVNGKTYLGYGAGQNSTGYSNVAIGVKALFNNIRDNIVAIGDSALYNNGVGATQTNQGIWNTAVGSKALYSNTIGVVNTAIGYHSLLNNTTGYANTAIGYHSLSNNSTGAENVANGAGALYSNTAGDYNTASGSGALFTNTNGVYNTAIGSSTMYFNTNGDENTAVGHESLDLNTTGNYNTSIGDHSLHSNITGVYNTGIGHLANTSSSDLFFATAIGADAVVNANYKVVIGNISVTSIGGFTDWSNFSDGRFKRNIHEDVPGLDFITRLRPVTYTLDVRGINQFLSIGEDKLCPNEASKKQTELNRIKEEGVRKKENIIYTGFVAQEVEKVAKEIGYNFSGLNKPQNDKDNYSLAYSQFVVPLVKAIQEQQKIILELKSELDELKKIVLKKQEQEK